MTAAEGDAPFPHLGFETVRQGQDKIVYPGDLRGAFDVLFGKVLAAIGDIEGDAALQKHGVLGDDADLPPKPLEVEPPDVLSVDEDRALLGIVKTGDEVGDG